MRRKLSDRQVTLLREILSKRRSDLLGFFERDGLSGMSQEDRNDVIDEVLAEFCATGLREDWEPNERGKELDDLISQFVVENWAEDIDANP